MSQFFYAGSDRQTVGPVSMDELRRLRAIGTISDNTPVIEDGGASWRRFGEYRSTAAPAGAARRHYPPLEAADIAHDRVAAAAARTSAKAEATALLLRDSVVRTFRAAATPGERAAVFGAVAGILAFFLPWAGGFGGSISGFGAARQASAVLFLLPISMAVASILSYLNIGATRHDRLLRARWLTVIGTFWCGITLLATLAGRSFFGVAGIGLYLTLVATVAVAVGGILQTGELAAGLHEHRPKSDTC